MKLMKINKNNKAKDIEILWGFLLHAAAAAYPQQKNCLSRFSLKTMKFEKIKIKIYIFIYI